MLLTLLDRGGPSSRQLRALAGIADTDREGMWRTGINVFFETFRAQRRPGPVNQGNQCQPGMVDVYAEVDRLHGRRDRRRTRPNTRRRCRPSLALSLMNRADAAFASFAGEQPSVPEAALDTLVHIWVTGIYSSR